MLMNCFIEPKQTMSCLIKPGTCVPCGTGPLVGSTKRPFEFCTLSLRKIDTWCSKETEKKGRRKKHPQINAQDTLHPILLPNPWTYSDVHVLEEDEERLSDQLKVPAR